jgi:hypothetical protein
MSLRGKALHALDECDPISNPATSSLLEREREWFELLIGI